MKKKLTGVAVPLGALYTKDNSVIGEFGDLKPFADFCKAAGISIIQLLDSTCGADGTKNMEARMNDVKERYGYYPEGKWKKNFELKAYFEKLMDRDFYEVIK